jgi:AraC-like DNA-binding protein
MVRILLHRVSWFSEDSTLKVFVTMQSNASATNWTRSTRVRLTRKLANVLDGVELSQFTVGDQLDLSPHDAWLLIAEGWAAACDEPQPTAAECDGRIPAAHQLATADSGPRKFVTIARSTEAPEGEGIRPVRQAPHEASAARVFGPDERERFQRAPNVPRTDLKPRPRESRFAASHTPSETKNASWIQRFHSILQSLAADPAVTEAVVAQKMNLSPWHFSRLLMRRTQMRFRMHLSLARLGIAARLLRESALSIKEVSARAGFSSASELNHHFRRIVRMTPTQYRAQAAMSFQQPAESQKLASISKNHQAS